MSAKGVSHGSQLRRIYLLFTKKRAKLLLFFELTKYFGKNLLIYLLFQLEGE